MNNVASPTEIGIEIIAFIQNNLIAEGVIISSATPLEQIGLDSMSIIEIVLFIERKFGLTLPDIALTKDNVYSVESISKCVFEYLVKN